MLKIAVRKGKASKVEVYFSCQIIREVYMNEEKLSKKKQLQIDRLERR
jgi:hypothetical protein